MNRKIRIALTICRYILTLAVGFYFGQMLQGHLVEFVVSLALIVIAAVVVWWQWVRMRPVWRSGEW